VSASKFYFSIFIFKSHQKNDPVATRGVSPSILDASSVALIIGLEVLSLINFASTLVEHVTEKITQPNVLLRSSICSHYMDSYLNFTKHHVQYVAIT
jgi:hypothetical protein